MPNHDMKYLVEHFVDWGKQRGLHNTVDLRPQFIKLAEEMGELAAAIARDNPAGVRDSVGDMLVVLAQLGAVAANKWYPKDPDGRSWMRENFLQHCMEVAWTEIKDREGQARDGVFVKEEK